MKEPKCLTGDIFCSLGRMGWFEAFRGQQGYTWYDDTRTAALVDVPLAAVTYFCTLVAIAVVIASLGIRGKEKWGAVVRTFYGVAIGSIILADVYGHCWLMGKVNISSTYVYRSRDQFTGEVGIQIGLHGANVTLRGYFGEPGRRGEVIYSEALPWADFGREEDKMLVYLSRGLPDPILKVAAYLCTDSGDLRWGRSFHMAGTLSCALLWTSFAFWIITNILLFSVIIYGAYLMILTGSTMVLASVVYHVLQPGQSLGIHFGDITLRTSYGWCFWLTLCTGAVTVIFGIILALVDYFLPKKAAEFLQVEIGMENDDRYESTMSLNDQSRRQSMYPSLGEKRSGSIFQEPQQGRRTSIFAETQTKRAKVYNNEWLSNNKNTSFNHGDRSSSSPAILNLKYGTDKIIEEDENDVLKDGQQNENDIRIEIEQELSTISSDTANELEEPRIIENNITNARDGMTTTINITSGRISRQSSDSGNEGSENCSSSHVIDTTSICS